MLLTYASCILRFSEIFPPTRIVDEGANLITDLIMFT